MMRIETLAKRFPEAVMLGNGLREFQDQVERFAEGEKVLFERKGETWGFMRKWYAPGRVFSPESETR